MFTAFGAKSFITNYNIMLNMKDEIFQIIKSALVDSFDFKIDRRIYTYEGGSEFYGKCSFVLEAEKIPYKSLDEDVVDELMEFISRIFEGEDNLYRKTFYPYYGDFTISANTAKIKNIWKHDEDLYYLHNIKIRLFDSEFINNKDRVRFWVTFSNMHDSNYDSSSSDQINDIIFSSLQDLLLIENSSRDFLMDKLESYNLIEDYNLETQSNDRKLRYYFKSNLLKIFPSLSDRIHEIDRGNSITNSVDYSFKDIPELIMRTAAFCYVNNEETFLTLTLPPTEEVQSF